MRLSAARITLSSCSTTNNVFPLSRSCRSTPMRRPVSRGCNPTLGSSSTNKVFTKEAPKHVVKVTRMTSPPLRLRVDRSKFK